MEDISGRLEPVYSERGEGFVYIGGAYEDRTDCDVDFYKDCEDPSRYYVGKDNEFDGENPYRRIIGLDYTSEGLGFCIKDILVPESEYQIIEDLSDRTIKVAYDAIANNYGLIDRKCFEEYYFGENPEWIPYRPRLLSLKGSKKSAILEISAEEMSDLSYSSSIAGTEYSLKERMSRFLFQVFMAASQRSSAELPERLFGLRDGIECFKAGDFLCVDDIRVGLEDILERFNFDVSKKEEFLDFCQVKAPVCFSIQNDYIELKKREPNLKKQKLTPEKQKLDVENFRIRVFSEPFFKAILDESLSPSSFSHVVNIDGTHYVSMGGAVKKTGTQIEIATVFSDSLGSYEGLNSYESGLYNEFKKYNTPEGIKKELRSFLVYLCDSLILDGGEDYKEGDELFSEVANFFIKCNEKQLDNGKIFLGKLGAFIEKIEKRELCQSYEERLPDILRLKKGIEFLTREIKVNFHPPIRVNGASEKYRCSKQSYFYNEGGEGNSCSLFALRNANIIEKVVKDPEFFEKVTSLEKEASKEEVKRGTKQKPRQKVIEQRERRMSTPVLPDERERANIPPEILPPLRTKGEIEKLAEEKIKEVEESRQLDFVINETEEILREQEQGDRKQERL